MSYLASLLPLLCYVLYPYIVDRVESHRPSLSALMSRQRRRWVRNAVKRETPLDAILSGNLMQSVSFFASTTILLVSAVFAVFGQITALRSAILPLQPDLPELALEAHLITILAMFILAFLAFTLSLRQFNHFCIMLGAAHEGGESPEAEITAMAALNSLGARNFNQGLRAYYFAIPMLCWFASPYLGLLVTVVMIGMLVYREFFSSARKLIADLESTRMN